MSKATADRSEAEVPLAFTLHYLNIDEITQTYQFNRQSDT